MVSSRKRSNIILIHLCVLLGTLKLPSFFICMHFQLPYMDQDMYNAAARGDIEIFKQTDDHGEELSLIVTPRKNTILHINITARTRERGDEESTQFIQQILDLCPSLQLQANAKGETALHMAARHGLTSTVKALLECAKKSHHNKEIESGIGAAMQMVRMTTISKDTALHEAVRHNHTSVVKILIREDLDYPYSGNEAGETPLYLAIERGYRDLVFEMLQTCTSPAHGGPNGRTSLHAAAIFNDEVITSKLLETKGSYTTEADDKGWTPLHYAAHFGHVSVLKELLHYDQSAAYIGDKDERKTAIHLAARQGHVDVMKELLSCCPDCCELVDTRGRNVVHFAMAGSNSDETLKFIQENSWLQNLVNEKDSKMKKCITKNVGAPDIVLSNGKISEVKRCTTREDGGKSVILKENTSLELAKDGSNNAKPLPHKKEEEARKKRKEPGKMRLADVSRKMSDTHLLVATLIATVTFTAGFTMPGGFNKDRGPTEGAAILIGNQAFQAFVITNTIALVFSSSSVAGHIFMGRRRKDNLVEEEMFQAMVTFTVVGMLSMAVAFITGTYAVLQHSSGLAIANCVTGCLFLGPLGLLYYTTLSGVEENT